MAHRERLQRDLKFVETASLEALMEKYPDAWKEVGHALVEAAATRRPAAIEQFVRSAQDAAGPHQRRVEKNSHNPEAVKAALPHVIHARLAYLGAQRTLQAAALASSGGRRRFGLWSGMLVSRLFFAGGLQRKPVSLRAFRWLWPLVTQKRLLMPLVQARGIYVFFSRELVQSLAAHIGQRRALEIGAGDGCLSRFLKEAGTSIRTTDDQSWKHVIAYPDDVEKMDAATALSRYCPGVVICSFPPPKNDFERLVFATPSVESYFVITTRHRFAAGDWQAYESQTAFDLVPAPEMTRQVLPPEIDPLVLFFRRKTAPPQS
jgi:hypothetical protein